VERERRKAMAKRKTKRPSRQQTKESREAKDLQALYARKRKEFSAADLQKYTEIEEGVPAEQVLAEMEEIYRKFSRKRG
jgi:hypothetical protein